MRYLVLLLLSLLLIMPAARAQTPVIDSLKREIAKNRKDSLEVSAYNYLSSEYARKNLPLAKQYALNAVVLAKRLNLKLQLSAAYSSLVILHVQTNQADSAAYYLAMLKDLAKNSDIVNVQTNYNFTAGLFYRKQGNYKASLPFMLEMLKISTRRHNKIAMAGQLLNIGNNYSDMSEYRKAMTSHLQALNLFEELDNKRGMSFCYGAISSDFINLNQFTQALPYIKKSLALKDELKDDKGRAASLLSLGEALEGLKQTDKALESYKQALAINKSLTLNIEEAKTDLSIAKLYAGKNDVNDAMLYFKDSRDLFTKLNDTAYLAKVNAEMVSLQKNYSQQVNAEKTYISSLGTSIRMGDKTSEINNYKYLANFYAKSKQFEKAFIYTEKYHNASDSIQNKELQLQVKELEQRFNLEKKQKEITQNKLLYEVALQKQKTLRYAAYVFVMMLITIGFLILGRYRAVHKARRIVEIEKMRNQIARNLHDDIGSTLSSINILSKVALKQLGGNEKVLQGLETIKNESFSIMESMSDIVWAINPANDPLSKTVVKMKEFASNILEPAGIEYRFVEDAKLVDFELGADERKNIYLTFKEAINNIAKYSGATLTDIVMQKAPHHFVLTINDNGKGFDSEAEYGGNGLKNMQNRAAEMKAVFEIKSAPGRGTRISLSIPTT